MNIDKSKYLQTEIPDELSNTIEHAISDSRLEAYGIVKRKGHLKTVIAFAACFMLCFVVLINTSEAFAKGISNIPIVNTVAKYFDFKHEEKEDKVKVVNITYPELKDIGNEKLQDKVNIKISKFVNDVVNECEERAEEYYCAYISTGGMKEEYIPYDIVVDYEIKSCNENYLSFVVYAYEKGASHYQIQKYYNLDLKGEITLSIKDILGTGYVEIIKKNVEQESKGWDKQIRKLMWDNVDYYEILNDDSNFYIDDSGKVYVVFNKYEIAAGAAGIIDVYVGKMY